MRDSRPYFCLPVGSDLPLYRQIQDNLVELIDNRLLEIGAALPSERQLSERYGVNRMTVRQAIDGLVQKGMLERRRGAGTFVMAGQPVQHLTPTVLGFSQRMREAGLRPSSQLLHRDIIVPDPIVQHHLQLEAEQAVIRLTRLRLVNDAPFMLETSYLEAARFSALMSADLEHESLYRILEHEYQLQVVEAEHTLEPTLPTPDEARHLGQETMMPAMLVRVIAYEAARTPLEMSRAIVRGDRCRYFFRVNTQAPLMD